MRPPPILALRVSLLPLARRRWGRSLWPWKPGSSGHDGTCGSECRLSDRILRTCLNPPIFAGRSPDGVALPADRPCCDRQFARPRKGDALFHCDDAFTFLALQLLQSLVDLAGLERTVNILRLWFAHLKLPPALFAARPATWSWSVQKLYIIFRRPCTSFPGPGK